MASTLLLMLDGGLTTDYKGTTKEKTNSMTTLPEQLNQYYA